jgi:carboxymethylenebutenolidase
MSQTEVSIPTPDGPARAFVFKPEGSGPWPAVIFFMDGPGIRPALFTMGERLAGHGYYVLMPDMFWRIGPYEPMNMAEAFKDEAARREIFGARMSSTDPVRSSSDTAAFLDFLSAQPEVTGDKVGVTGYCMGGAMALRAAGTYPDRVAAAASFHGGRLATDAPDSPHLLAPKIKAKVFVAAAVDDASFPPEQGARLKQALDWGAVDNQVVFYEGALHGYAPPDMPVYNREASERHWRDMLALFDETLKASV